MNKDLEIMFKEPKKTFLEVLKVHKNEVVMSNLLAYFFRPKESHGLKTLFLDTLLKFINETNEHQAYDKNSVEVKVEQKTSKTNKSAKRIDVLIKTNVFVIAIEFKINHELNNPLQEYKNYVEKEFKDLNRFYIILTPYKKESKNKAFEFHSNEENKTDFKQIILSKFIREVKDNLPSDSLMINCFDVDYFQVLTQTIENRKIQSLRNNQLCSLKKELKEGNYHTNFQGGFLEIKYETYNLKIRITENGWQIEKWGIQQKGEKPEKLSFITIPEKEDYNIVISNMNSIKKMCQIF